MTVGNPYAITGPAVLSISGGKTSGFLLRQVLDAHGGVLPPDVVACFANTGKERAETLEFLADMAAAWAVPLVWLEWQVEAPHWRIVTPSTASRNGEPFAALIDKRKFLPNPVTRFCTQELKIRVMKSYAQSLGWTHWTNVVGLRADEPGRVGKAMRPRKDRWTVACPLADARHTLDDVTAFWDAQPFTLRLRPHEGNCDLCFLKGRAKISAILEREPERAAWWSAQEQRMGNTFRADRPCYADLAAGIARSPRLDLDIFEDQTECEVTCTD